MKSFLAAVIGVLLLILGIFPASGHEEPKHTSEPAAQARKTRVPDEQSTQAYFTDLPLLNQEGKRVRFYTDVLKDRVVLISFIYSTCTDACPLIMHKLSEIKGRLGDKFGKQVFFVSLSVDPERDTPEVLAQYAKQQKADHPGWIFLTGEKKNVDTILRKLGQYNAQFEAHSTIFLAGNVKTRHWAKFSPVATVPAIAFRLEDMASESPPLAGVMSTSEQTKK